MVLALVGALVACGDSAPTGVRAALSDYVAALSDGNPVLAAGLTSSPEPAARVIGQTLRDMNADSLEVEYDNVQQYSGGKVTFDLKTHWNFGADRDWEYTTKGSASDLSIGWRLTWEPDLLAPGLTGSNSLRQIRTDARSPKVLDADGEPLMFAGPVHRIQIDPNNTKDLDSSFAQVVKIVAPVAPLVTSDVLKRRAKESPGDPVEVLQLRGDDYDVLEDDLDTVPGLRQTRSEGLLISNRQLFSPLFGWVQQAWRANRDATAGWSVQLVPAQGPPQQIVGFQGPPGPDIRTTIDPKTQLQVENAVVQLGQPAAMAVVSVRSGAILAGAQNNYAGLQSQDWLIDTMKTPGPVLDPIYETVNSSAGKDPAKQRKLLAPLGFGTTFEITGAKIETAQLPGVHGRPESELGPDTVAASPIGAAMLAAAVSKGSGTVPYLVDGQPGVGAQPVGEVDPKLLAAVKAAMDATMAPSGDGSDLTSTGVRALVGTNGPNGPGWFIGFHGDQAMAIMVTGPASGSGALQVARAFLK